MSDNNKGNKRGWTSHTMATALSYEPGDTAPKVIATGQGFVASKILEKAKEADIPVYKDELLSEELRQLSLGENIPPELYQAVAQVLLFIMELDRGRDGYGK